MLALSAPEIAELSALLDEAMPLDLPQRRAWLDRLAPRHGRLMAALRRSLLEEAPADAFGDSLMTLPRFDDPAGGRLRPRAHLECGSRVGPYRLMLQLGAGGMAEVWQAQRADGAFRREVALKVPMFSDRRPDLPERFARECDILAGLEHVNIARMYDAGTTPDGLPYLAMEYVRGSSLVDWCDARRLGAVERVGLFMQVLDAMQYAHGRNVVHRDLKPSNILVTDDGQVRLLDFGVACLAGGKGDTDEHDAQLTRQYGRALTPDYASPELLCGEAADARSDIYSLGVVLYELLTGSRPYRTRTDASITQVRREIAATRLVPPALRMPHGPELERIVLKALSRKPRARYESVAEMAADLERFIARCKPAARTRPIRPLAGVPGPALARRAPRLAPALARWLRLGAPAVAVTAIASVALWAIFSAQSPQAAGSGPPPCAGCTIARNG